MTIDYKAILRSHDDPGCWETPIGFDRKLAEKKFLEFHCAMETSFDRQFEYETGASVQDASFHSLLKFRVSDNEYVSIRFSNFGRMVGMCEETCMPVDTLSKVKNILGDHGYVFIPLSELEEEYTGSNPGVTGIRDWWIRFFDYV